MKSQLRELMESKHELYEDEPFASMNSFTAHYHFRAAEGAHESNNQGSVKCLSCGNDIKLRHHEYTECSSCNGLYLLRGAAVYTDVEEINYGANKEAQ